MAAPEYIFVPEFGYEVSKRVRIHKEPEFIGSYHLSRFDTGEIVAFAHLDVYDFSATVLRNMLKAWKDRRHELPSKLFAMFEEDNRARDRFIRKLGFIVVGSIPCTDGNARLLYAHFI